MEDLTRNNMLASKSMTAFVETHTEVSLVSMGNILCGELVMFSVDRRKERNRARACIDICSWERQR